MVESLFGLGLASMAFQEDDILDEMATDMGLSGEAQDDEMGLSLALATPAMPVTPGGINDTNMGISGEQRVCVYVCMCVRTVVVVIPTVFRRRKLRKTSTNFSVVLCSPIALRKKKNQISILHHRFKMVTVAYTITRPVSFGGVLLFLLFLFRSCVNGVSPE